MGQCRRGKLLSYAQGRTDPPDAVRHPGTGKANDL